MFHQTRCSFSRTTAVLRASHQLGTRVSYRRCLFTRSVACAYIAPPALSTPRSSICAFSSPRDARRIGSRTLFRPSSAVVGRPTDPHAASDASILVPCPYRTGARLTLHFTPLAELSNTHDGASAMPIEVEVEVLRTFEPFTLAQVMLVRHTSSHPSLRLPGEFVLKLMDPRFCEPNDRSGLNRAGWSENCHRQFIEGLKNVRSGLWQSYWMTFGADSDVSVLRRDDGYWEAPAPQRNFTDELDKWERLRRTLHRELAVYMHLRRLQGHGIPVLYGACRCVPADDLEANDLGADPYVSDIPGLAIEYIDGVAMSKLIVGRDISEVNAERVSQGVLSVVRGIRDHLVLHEDLARRNIIVRPGDLDHPVIIDFGSARLRSMAREAPSEEEWIAMLVREKEIFRLRVMLGGLGFHIPSPVPEEIEDDALYVAAFHGHRMTNATIEDLPAEWREKLYERVEIVPESVMKTAENGMEYVWDYPRWQIKEGIHTENASADYKWGKAQYGWSASRLTKDL